MNYQEFLTKQQEIEESVKFVIEGINIDNDNRIVSYDSSHQNNVNTSIKFNPTINYINKHKVISIFKRNNFGQRTDGDGNPLIYALKNIQNWKISNRDIISLLKQFIRISEKIDPIYDTIITIPSSNPLNTNFLYRLNKIIKCNDTITDHIFSKLNIDEVFENVDFSIMTPEESYDMKQDFNKMKGETFKFKFVKPHLRKYITNIWSDSSSCWQLDVAKFINDKDVLVLDDTIASGQTISTFCDNIIKNYTPKSITIITLFSAL